MPVFLYLLKRLVISQFTNLFYYQDIKMKLFLKNFLGNLEMTLKYTLQAYLASIMLIRVFNLALVEVIKQIPLCLFLESTTLFNFQCFSFCFMQHWVVTSHLRFTELWCICKEGVILKSRHGLRGKESRILWRRYLSLSP